MAETDWKKEMDKRISDIEAEIGNLLSQGREPKYFICSTRTIEDILNTYCPKEEVAKLDWRKGVSYAFGDGEIVLRIFRTVDMNYGEYIIC